MKRDNKTHPTAGKLRLHRETVRKLQSHEMSRVAGGRPASIFGCETTNCLTLGSLCATHDCTLTFTSCAC